MYVICTLFIFNRSVTKNPVPLPASEKSKNEKTDRQIRWADQNAINNSPLTSRRLLHVYVCSPPPIFLYTCPSSCTPLSSNHTRPCRPLYHSYSSSPPLISSTAIQKQFPQMMLLNIHMTSDYWQESLSNASSSPVTSFHFTLLFPILCIRLVLVLSLAALHDCHFPSSFPPPGSLYLPLSGSLWGRIFEALVL